MKVEELREEIAIELESLEATVQELVALREDVALREPTVVRRRPALPFWPSFTLG